MSVSDAEKRFQEDLETAKALSLETMALNKFKQEKLKEDNSLKYCQNSQTSVYSKVNRKYSEPSIPSMESTSPTPQIKPRPRPGGVSRSAGLVPPPLPKRQISLATASNDLINLKSPIMKSDPQDALLQELDLACPNLNVSNSKTMFFSSNCLTTHIPNSICHQPSLPTPNLPLPKLQFRRAAQLPVNNQRLNNQDLIDLGVDTAHPRYSILSAFDPLLSSKELMNQGNGNSSTLRDYELKEYNSKTEDSAYNQDYDPFDYFLGMSQKTSKSTVDTINPTGHTTETIYEVLSKEHSPVKVSSSTQRSSSISSHKKEMSLNISINQII